MGSGIRWDEGVWTHPPRTSAVDGADLVVEAAEGSDAWRHTSYGFVHDSEHALLTSLPDGSAMEVTFVADLPEQFDQAGLYVARDERHWIKAGVEMADGSPQLGAVVTWPLSDWSVAPVSDWRQRAVTVRGSLNDGALTVRARADHDAWRLVRLIPVPSGTPLRAGPYVCAPTRVGLVVRFTSWVRDRADISLH
jgi:regulation of enolase protein 1 (concanavalin A-like superfamily)